MIPQHLKDWKPVCKKSKCGSQITLLLNDDKTQIFQFGPKEHSGGKSFDLGALTPYLTSVVKDLGFHLDNSLKLDKQINYNS